MKITILDGAVDLLNNTPFVVPPEELNLESASPVAMRFKVKTGLTSINLSDTFPAENVTAVDWGTVDEVDYNPLLNESVACGEEITIFLRPVNVGFGYGIYQSGFELGKFLSQIDTQYTPFPQWFCREGEYPLLITNPDYKAPKGMFENIDFRPVFNTRRYGGEYSLFKTAPKIWASLAEVAQFPPKGYYTESSPYAPFAGCPNVTKIEAQGEFGEELEYLGPCDFMQYDENGFADPSAYPYGGAPRVVDRYTVPVEKYSFDLGYTYPQFDMTRCVEFKAGYQIGQFYVGQNTTSMSATLPIGIGFNESKVMEYLSLKLPKLVMESGNFTGNFYFGAKAFGIKIPNTVQKVFGFFEIDNMYVEEQADPGNNPPLYPDLIPSHQQATQPLTPEFAKTKLSFSYGAALEKIFDPDEELIIPDPPDGLITVSDYALNKGASAAVTYVSKKADGNWGFYQVKPLPDGCQVIGSYCENLYSNQTLGANTHLWLGETGEQEKIEVTGNVTIPKLPTASRIVRNNLVGTFRGAQGNAEVEHITNPDAAETKTYLFYGNSAADTDDQTGMTVIANFQPKIDGKIEQEWGRRYGENEDEGYILMAGYIMQNTGQLPDTYMTNLLTGGIVIESGPLPALEFAINWQQDCWLDATIDPSSIDTLIIPIPEGVKSENAYNRALQIGVPSTNGELFLYSGNTFGRNPDQSLASNEDGRARIINFATWQNPFAPVDLKQYDRFLSDINLPNFIVTNTEGVTYDAFSDAFGNIYGDPDDFFTRFGVDDSITDTESRRGYLGLMEPNYRNMNAMPWTQFVFTWKSVLWNSPGDFNEGRWLSFPKIEHTIPRGEKRPDQQLALYKYKYEYARINNSPDSVPVELNIDTQYGAQYFRQQTLTW